MPIVTATFETRREAELAIEHLVQEHGVERDEITVGTEGDDNSVGTEIGGADQDLDDSDADEAALNGAIAVVVTVEDDELAETVQEFLEEFGGGDVTVAD